MLSQLKVLIIEDSAADAELIEYELKQNFLELTAVRIQTAEEMLEKLAGENWDIILSDHSLPEFSAQEALDIYRESGLEIPFIVVSGQIGEEKAADFMRGGCHDYVSKNNLSRLGPAVRREVDEFRARRQQEEIRRQLFREKELFSVTLRSIGEGVIVTDIEGRVVFVNQAAEELCGWVNETAAGRLLAEVFNVLDSKRRPTAGRACQAVIKERQVRGLTRGSILIDARGHEKAVSASLAPINDEDGQTVGVVVVFRDVTRFIEAEEAVARSRDHYLSLFEEFPAMIWQSGVDGKCNYFNHAWREYTGRKPGVPFAFIWSDSVHPDFVEPLRTKFLRSYEKRQPFEIEYLMMRKDRQYRWIRNVARPFADLKGQFGGYIGSCYDITDIKNVLNEMLKAKETAEAANSMKNQFLANVSHEVRTPLNGIMGMTELTLATELNGEQRDNLVMIRESAEALMMIIAGILDFSSMEAGKIVLENLDFNLLELMDKTAKRFHHAAGQKRLNLVVKVDPEVPEHLKGDSLRLQQVLVNLIGNALKFTETGEVNVEVACREWKQRRVVLEFSVRDTGIGIRKEDMGKLFKSFSQVDGSYTRKYGGIGLGLSISAQLVEMMGGKIEVESMPGQGSRFYFTAAFGISDNQPREEKVQARTFGCYFSPVRQRRILVVEDNRISRQVASRMLRRWGHHVLEAENGREALQVLSEHCVDMVLMDVQMPVMDGIETVRRIRQSSERRIRNVPVVALTAHALKGDRERFNSLGMDAYLSKPFSESELFAIIEKLAANLPEMAADWENGHIAAGSQIIESAIREGVRGIIDLDELMERLNNDIDFAYKMVSGFFQDGRKRLDNMLLSLRYRDYDDIEKEAHSLKGAASYIGAGRIKNLAFKTEMASRNEDPGQISPLLAELSTIFSKADSIYQQTVMTAKGEERHEDINCGR